MKKKKINTDYGKIQSVSGYKKVNTCHAHDVLVARYVAEISIAEESQLKSLEHASRGMFVLHLAG